MIAWRELGGERSMAQLAKLRRLVALTMAALLQVTVAAAELPPRYETGGPPAPVEGVWLTTEQSELTIQACPEGYCGYITKIVVPEEIMAKYGAEIEKMDPASFYDGNNKDPALRSRPMQDLQILTLTPTNNPWFFDGKIYNPQDGNIYDGSVEILGADLIRLKGCVLYVLCQEQDWQRVLVTTAAE